MGAAWPCTEKSAKPAFPVPFIKTALRHAVNSTPGRKMERLIRIASACERNAGCLHCYRKGKPNLAPRRSGQPPCRTLDAPRAWHRVFCGGRFPPQNISRLVSADLSRHRRRYMMVMMVTVMMPVMMWRRAVSGKSAHANSGENGGDE